MRASISMALRNLLRRRRHYLTLGAAMALCCAVMTTFTGSLEGMRRSLEAKAALYYGGDFNVLGLQKDGFEIIYDAQAALKALRLAGGGGLSLAPRIEDRSPQSYLFFGGDSIQLKMISGVDWAVEGPAFSKLNFVSGGTEGLESGDGIIVSEPMAQALGARVGDDILLLTSTFAGQKNTATAVLRGVFRDSSFFGADTAYVARDFLRSLIAYPEGAVSMIGGSFTRLRPSARSLARLQRALEGLLPMFPQPASREELLRMQESGDWEGQRYAMLSLSAHVRQIEQVVELLSVVLYSIVGLLLGVVVLGVANTYRVIVFERTREIGTLRALGMQRSGVARLFLAEAACLAATGAIVGIALGLALLTVIGSFSFSWIPGFDVFLSHGRIAWAMDPGLLLAVVGIMLTTALLASWAPASRAARLEPAAAYIME